LSRAWLRLPPVQLAHQRVVNACRSCHRTCAWHTIFRPDQCLPYAAGCFGLPSQVAPARHRHWSGSRIETNTSLFGFGVVIPAPLVGCRNFHRVLPLLGGCWLLAYPRCACFLDARDLRFLSLERS